MSQISSIILGSGGAGPILTLTGNSGGAVPPTAGNINVVGTGSITVTGNPGTSTLTISSSGGGGITSIAGDTGGAQTGPALTLTGLTTAGSTVSFAGAANAITFNVTDVANFNTIVGSGAGNGTVSGQQNTAFGYFAAHNLTSGQFGVGFGHGANLACTSGNRNHAFGYTSLAGNITGSSNCAFGMQSLVQLATTTATGGSFNCAFGELAGFNYTGNESSNVCVSNQGTLGDNNIIRLGTDGTGNGEQSQTYIAGNVAVARNLQLPTTSATVGQVTINSVPALQMFGTNNIFVGGAGNLTLSGTNNVAISPNSLVAATSTSNNVSIGVGSMQFQASSGNCVSIGYQACNVISGGAGCVAIGYQALANQGSGSNSIAIGSQSGFLHNGADNSNIDINNQGTTGQSNTLRIGSATGTGAQQLNQAFICGINGITVTGVPVLVSASDQLGIAVSSERYKQDIEDMDDYSDEIHELRCVTFNYKQDPNAEYKSVGLIAEEVENIIPQLVVKDKEGLPMTVKYLDLIPMLLNEIQKLKQDLDTLREEFDASEEGD